MVRRCVQKATGLEFAAKIINTKKLSARGESFFRGGRGKSGTPSFSLVSFPKFQGRTKDRKAGLKMWGGFYNLVGYFKIKKSRFRLKQGIKKRVFKGLLCVLVSCPKHFYHKPFKQVTPNFQFLETDMSRVDLIFGPLRGYG